FYSYRQAADDFYIKKTTLIARCNGRKTCQEAHEGEMKLTPAQEEVLVEWIRQKGRRFIP
ncbi:hypothetical protein K435DRAFT_636469, partial [Dendrothele bispora CBS 962.96]